MNMPVEGHVPTNQPTVIPFRGEPHARSPSSRTRRRMQLPSVCGCSTSCSSAPDHECRCHYLEVWRTEWASQSVTPLATLSDLQYMSANCLSFHLDGCGMRCQWYDMAARQKHGLGRTPRQHFAAEGLQSFMENYASGPIVQQLGQAANQRGVALMRACCCDLNLGTCSQACLPAGTATAACVLITLTCPAFCGTRPEIMGGAPSRSDAQPY